MPPKADHAGKQEERGLAVMADEVLRGAGELLEARFDRLGLTRDRGPVRREQEQRQDEQHVPQRRERADEPVALSRGGIERDEWRKTEQGLARARVRNEQRQCQEQTHQTADIADRPADARQGTEALA